MLQTVRRAIGWLLIVFSVGCVAIGIASKGRAGTFFDLMTLLSFFLIPLGAALLYRRRSQAEKRKDDFAFFGSDELLMMLQNRDTLAKEAIPLIEEVLRSRKVPIPSGSQ